jgi:hypothetical protein
MKLFNIDNAGTFEHFPFDRIVTKGKKSILIPAGYKILPTGGFIPHIRNKAGSIKKYCHKCRQWLFIQSFGKNKYSKDGYKDICRQCDNKARRERYAKTKAVQ